MLLCKFVLLVAGEWLLEMYLLSILFHLFVCSCRNLCEKSNLVLSPSFTKKIIRKYRQEDLLLMFEVIVEQIHRAIILLPQWRSVSSHTACGKPSVYCHQHELVISVCLLCA